MPKKVNVEFCLTNLCEYSQELFDRLETEFPAEIELKEIGCLGLCDMCDQGPYCIVANRVIRARTLPDLFPLVTAEIRRRLAE